MSSCPFSYPGVGVGNATATPTAALLLSVLQESAGRLATVLFAHRAGAALAPEAKRYRLTADLLNDSGALLDLAAPSVPQGALRNGVLAASGVLRALCGVAAGGAKASLSVHFAGRMGNVGDLNAVSAMERGVCVGREWEWSEGTRKRGETNRSSGCTTSRLT